jgi:hypothetical protein
VRLDDDLYILIERHEKTQKAFDGEMPKLSAQHLGYIGLADAKQFGRLNLFQAAMLHDGVNFEHQLRLDQVLLGIRNPDIFEHIRTAGFIGLFCSASRRRCLINSIGA